MRQKTTLPCLNLPGKLLVVATILLSAGGADAGLRPLRLTQTYSTPASFFSFSTQQKKRIVSWRRRDTPSGPHFVVTCDSSLDDYSSFAEGERLVIRIPQAALANEQRELARHGLVEVQVESREADVLFSVRVLKGATVRITQKFNRLEIIFLIHQQTDDSSVAPLARSEGDSRR